MLDVMQAVVTYFNANLSATFPGGLYEDRIPSSTTTPTYPYCVYQFIGIDKNDLAFTNKIIENPTLQFSAYSNGVSSAMTAAEAVTTAFDAIYNSGAVALTGGRWLSLTRPLPPLPAFEGQDEQGNDVHKGVVRYNLSVQR